jgi:hypothetical protein
MSDQNLTQAMPVADPAIALPMDPAAVTDPTATKSPLDVLDQILNEAQAKVAQSAEAKAQEEERILREESERRKREDAQKLQQQIVDLQTIKQSPQYQARIEQEEEVKVTEEKKAEELEGNEILQLKRTSI